jgi:glycosyl transferase family 87
MTRDRTTRVVVTAVMVILGLGALRDFSRLHASLPWRNMDDFPDFYCAGWVLDHRANPYLYEPLHTCEHRVNVGNSFRDRLFERNSAIAVPAPQPPFDFAPFMLFGQLPFGAARIIDAVAIVLAVMLVAVALAALGIPLSLSAAALALSTVYAELNTGQIVPFAMLALVLCGVALARGKDGLAGICAIITAVEPTVGLPVALAILIFVPRARGSLLATGLVLAVLSLAISGPHELASYLIAVLPAHAASELHFPFQYSLTYAAMVMGLPAPLAQIAGDASYALLLVAGLVLARRSADALSRRELLVFVPALCAVIAGPFLHQEELCFALPALLVFAVAARGRARLVAAFALCLLAIPWIAVWGAKQLFLPSIFVSAAILLALRIDLRTALAFLLVVAGSIYAFELHPPHLPVPPPGTLRVYAANDLVQAEWRDYTEARATSDPLWLAIKLPAWLALLAGLALAVYSSFRPPPASESSRESWRETPRRSPA